MLPTHLTYDKIVCTAYTWNMLYLPDRTYRIHGPKTVGGSN
ncbi:hypothetical protein QUA56_33480 [Microcoleus sp. N3A4]